MRILVTGVTGQVGGALVRAAAAVGNRDGGRSRCARSRRAAGDCRHARPPDARHHLQSGRLHRRRQGRGRARTGACAINAEAPGRHGALGAARDVPLIHFSTDYVFDGSGERAWREDDAPRPLSVYGATKLAGENAIRERRRLVPDRAHLLGLCRRRAKTSCAPSRGLARERNELRIVADQIGAPTSAALIGDVVAGMLSEGLETLRELCAGAGGLVHLAASGETSWYGFAGGDRRGTESPRRGAFGRAHRADCHGRLSDQSAAAAAIRGSTARACSSVFGVTPPPGKLRWRRNSTGWRGNSKRSLHSAHSRESGNPIGFSQCYPWRWAAREQGAPPQGVAPRGKPRY